MLGTRCECAKIDVEVREQVCAGVGEQAWVTRREHSTGQYLVNKPASGNWKAGTVAVPRRLVVLQGAGADTGAGEVLVRGAEGVTLPSSGD